MNLSFYRAHTNKDVQTEAHVGHFTSNVEKERDFLQMTAEDSVTLLHICDAA